MAAVTLSNGVVVPDPPKPDNLITSTYLKNTFLFGIPTEGFATTCEKLPEEALTQAINAAYAWMETELTCTIIPQNFLDEAHPYCLSEYVHWAHFNLYHYPILNMWRCQAVFPTSQPNSGLDFPTEWFRYSKLTGIFNLVPSGGSIANYLIGQGGAFLPLALSGYYDQIPDLFHFDYTAGFKHIPDDMNDLIARKAANNVLAIISDILFPPGTTSMSTGIDGVSQSVSLTRSQLLFQSRINENKEAINQTIPQLRMRYTGIRFSVG